MTQCYMCENNATSREHIPPICIFPEKKDLPPGVDYRKNLIRVPSCSEHNLRKSGDDEYLLFLLVTNSHTNKVGLKQWATKVLRSIEYRPTKVRIFRNMRLFLFRGLLMGHFDINIYRINAEIEKISRGIYYYHYHKHWPYPIDIVNPSAFATGNSNAENNNYYAQATNELITKFLENEVINGENPEIFHYQYRVDEMDPYYLLRMVFYDGVTISTLSKLPEVNRDKPF